MTTVKFSEKNEVVAALLRALATKSAGPKAKIGGLNDSLLRETGVYTFDLDWHQHNVFKNYVKEYLRDEHQLILQITTDREDIYKGF